MERTFSFEGLISIGIGILSILVTLWLYYAEIKKLLNAILKNKKESFSKEQAKDFCLIYIKYISAELHKRVDYVLLETSQNFPQAYQIANKMLQYKDEFTTTLSHIRGQTSEFCLVNGVSFKRFIESANPKFVHKIEDGKKTLFDLLTDFSSQKLSITELGSKLHYEIEIISNDIIEIVYNELNKVYGN